MELLDCMKEIVAFFLLIQWTHSHNSSLNIGVTCNKSDTSMPKETIKMHKSNPSPVHELTAELSESQTSVIIRWSINVDGSIRTLTGTWISFLGEPELYYRCEYQPPFTSEQISLTGQEQLWFSFTVPNVSVCHTTSYYISAYNIPPPSSDGPNKEYMKITETAEVQWSADINAVLNWDKIVVTFNTNLVADRHTILLTNGEKRLEKIEWKGQCKVEKCEVELKYMEHMGPCEKLLISIIPHFKHCEPESQWKSQKVICISGIYYRWALAIGVGCVLTLLFMYLCCCVIYRIIQRVRASKRATNVRVLVVYPAVDTMFQHSVLLLAESLQSRGGVSVIIDMWEKESLAEQGPLRWLNTQAELAERVLIILAPQRTQTDDLKSKLVPSMPDDTVSASASNLFALALNLVTSSAHDPHTRDKFWVINLDHDEKCVQTELRGRRMFVLPRDLKKLHRQLLSGAVESPKLVRCFRSFNCKNSSEQLEMNTDFPSCAKPVSLDKNPCISSY